MSTSQSPQMQLLEPPAQSAPIQDGACVIFNVWAGARNDNPAPTYFGLVDQPTAAPIAPGVGMRIWFPISPGSIVNWSPPRGPQGDILGYRFDQGLWLVHSETSGIWTPPAAGALDALATWLFPVSP